MTAAGIMWKSPWKNRLFISLTALERCWQCGFDTDARTAGSHSHRAVASQAKGAAVILLTSVLAMPGLADCLMIWLKSNFSKKKGKSDLYLNSGSN